jgi:hypothetical protein
VPLSTIGGDAAESSTADSVAPNFFTPGEASSEISRARVRDMEMALGRIPFLLHNSQRIAYKDGLQKLPSRKLLILRGSQRKVSGTMDPPAGGPGTQNGDLC